MAWTIAPAIILAGLAFQSKKVWDDFRYSPSADDPNRRRFWSSASSSNGTSFIPAPTKAWPYLHLPQAHRLRNGRADKTAKIIFANVAGPASLPYDDAVNAINNYIDQINPLGKDFDDPDGKDDNWDKRPAAR